MTPGPGIEPGTHWWKASALTTTPTLLPQRRNNGESPEILKDGRMENHPNIPKQETVNTVKQSHSKRQMLRATDLRKIASLLNPQSLQKGLRWLKTVSST